MTHADVPSRPALRRPDAGEEPRIHRHRGRDARARHRREHDGVHSDRHAPLPPAARVESRRPRLRLPGAHRASGLLRPLGARLPVLPGSQPGVLGSRGRLFVRADQLRDLHRVQGDQRQRGHGELLPSHRSAARARAILSAGRRPGAGPRSSGGHQRELLAHAVRERSANRRQSHSTERHLVHDRRRRAEGFSRRVVWRFGDRGVDAERDVPRGIPVLRRVA